MATLTMSQVGQVAMGAGLTRDQAVIAAAIAKAESGLNPRAHNPRPPDDSYGLWQINMLGSLGPSRRRTFNIASNDALYDPATNAHAMFVISNRGTNWKPWTTYTRGTYRAYLSEAKSAIGGNTSPVSIPSPVQGFQAFSKAINTLMDETTWIRVGLFLTGLTLILLAIFKMTAGDSIKSLTKNVGKTVAKEVTK